MSSFSLSKPSLISPSSSPPSKHRPSLSEKDTSSSITLVDSVPIPAVDNISGLISHFRPPPPPPPQLPPPQLSLLFVPVSKVFKRSSHTSVSSEVMRRGFVSVKEDTFSSIFWTEKWLVLMEKTSHKTKNSNIIHLCDITNIERTDRKPCCLLINTKTTNIFLSFESDEELYAWQDDIYSRCFLSGPGVFSCPTHFVHRVHVGFDPISGLFTGLPKHWMHLQTESAMMTQRPNQGAGVNSHRPISGSSITNEHAFQPHANSRSVSMQLMASDLANIRSYRDQEFLIRSTRAARSS